MINVDEVSLTKHETIRAIQHLYNPKILAFYGINDKSSKKCGDLINRMRKTGSVTVIIIKDQ